MMKNRLLIILLLFMTAFPLAAREVTPFNNGWSFKKGPFAADPVLFGGTAANGWREVAVPHTWNNVDMQNDRNNYYAGEAYYKKSYTPAKALEGKRVFLRFEGVGSVAEVYVNGEYAGNHKGAYSAFAIELSRLLKYGEPNEILVKVDNSPRPDVIPINNTLFGVYGGIYRPVSLLVTEKVNIAVTDFASPGIYISQKDVNAKSASVEVKIKLENKNTASREVTLATTIYEADGKVKAHRESKVDLAPQGRQFAIHDFTVKNPHLWQGLEDPYLYKVVTRVTVGGAVVDEVAQPLGLRRFELRTGDGMYLNSRKVPMYGVCRHQDWWGSGSALSNAQHDADLEIIREVGATTIRLAHYQQSEYIYAKCDSIGFLVWAEIPYVNRVSTKEADNARTQLIELIRQNYNHPSIYVWGLHNEVYQPFDYTAALTEDLDDLAKSEDPGRYTVSVSGYSKMDVASNNYADIQGINHYFGWYNGKIGDVEGWVKGLETDYPDHKVIFSEYGAEANIDQQEETVGDVGRYFSQFYPETFATKFHEIHWGVISKHPYLLASYIWNTFDFATPATTQGGVEARNMKGLVTFDRKVKKDAFYWYKANWSREPVLYITQRRAAERENKVTPVTVYSNVGTPRLFVNGLEVSKFSTGTTGVHYIFDGVELRHGENTIEVRATKNGEAHRDKIVWNYRAGSGGPNGLPRPQERKTEHTGL